MIPLLSFLAPTRLWLLLLIPLLVVVYLLMVRRKRNRSMHMGKTMFDLVIPRDRTWLRHLAVGLSILSLLTLTLAFAKPKDQVSVPRALQHVMEEQTFIGRVVDNQDGHHNLLCRIMGSTNLQAIRRPV